MAVDVHLGINGSLLKVLALNEIGFDHILDLALIFNEVDTLLDDGDYLKC